MNRTFLSTFMKCTCAAVNGLAASTEPDTAAVPAICAASCASTGAIAVVPPRVVRVITSNVARIRRPGGMATLLSSEAAQRGEPAPLSTRTLGRGLTVVNRCASLIGHSLKRMSHGLLEALGPAPLLWRPALAVRADLIHRGVHLDVESVWILELDSRIPSRATTPLVDDRHVPGTKKIANLEQLGDRADLEGAVVEAGLPLARRLVERLGRHERDRMMVRRVSEEDHAALVAIGHLKPHDLRPEPRGPLDVAHREHDVTQFLHLDRRLARHFFSPPWTCGPAILCRRPGPRQPPSGLRESRSRIAGYTAPGRDRRSGRKRVRSTADNLRRLTSAIVKAGGSAASEADLVAEHLVRANLMGHDSHGVGMIPTYIRHLKAGLVVPNTRAKRVKDDGAMLMFDGGRGYGRRVAGEAMSAAITRCRETGVVAMTLANAHHIGRVGAYGEMASGAGLVSLHFVNVTDHRATVAPFRGTDARFVTNPVCIAVPGTDRHAPLLLDMATSQVAMGKIRVAKNEGKPAPEGALIDSKGKPTRDPNVMYSEPNGALLPFGGHKGYALAVVTELLATALTGGPSIQPGNQRMGGVVNNMFTMLVDPARLAGIDWLKREIDGFLDYVKASPPADPKLPVLVPGEPERLAQAERGRAGIEVDATTWGEILAAAEAVGLSRAEAASLGG